MKNKNTVHLVLITSIFLGVVDLVNVNSKILYGVLVGMKDASMIGLTHGRIMTIVRDLFIGILLVVLKLEIIAKIQMYGAQNPIVVAGNLWVQVVVMMKVNLGVNVKNLTAVKVVLVLIQINGVHLLNVSTIFMITKKNAILIIVYLVVMKMVVLFL